MCDWTITKWYMGPWRAIFLIFQRIFHVFFKTWRIFITCNSYFYTEGVYVQRYLRSRRSKYTLFLTFSVNACISKQAWTKLFSRSFKITCSIMGNNKIMDSSVGQSLGNRVVLHRSVSGRLVSWRLSSIVKIEMIKVSERHFIHFDKI